LAKKGHGNSVSVVWNLLTNLPNKCCLNQVTTRVRLPPPLFVLTSQRYRCPFNAELQSIQPEPSLKNTLKGWVQCFSIQVVINKCFLVNREKNLAQIHRYAKFNAKFFNFFARIYILFYHRSPMYETFRAESKIK